MPWSLRAHALQCARWRRSLLQRMALHIKTTAGFRLLRQSLLQPLCDQPTIETRLDAVDELLDHETIFFELSAVLPQLNDMGTERAARCRVCRSLRLLPRPPELCVRASSSARDGSDGLVACGVVASGAKALAVQRRPPWPQCWR